MKPANVENAPGPVQSRAVTASDRSDEPSVLLGAPSSARPARRGRAWQSRPTNDVNHRFEVGTDRPLRQGFGGRAGPSVLLGAPRSAGQ